MAMPQDQAVVPTYFIYRESVAGQPVDPTSQLQFFPAKDTDELFDALRAKYPHVSTHSERMRNAVIEFLIEERDAEAADPMDMGSAWSSPDLYNLATPAMSDYSSRSHQPSLSQQSSVIARSEPSPPSFTQQSSYLTPSEPSPPSLSQMTGVFSVSATAQPKQRTRRKMTEAEKIAYRNRRIVKACDKCARRKRKCHHNNQAPVDDVSTARHKSNKAAAHAPTHSQSSAASQVTVDSSTTPPLFNEYDIINQIDFSPFECSDMELEDPLAKFTQNGDFFSDHAYHNNNITHDYSWTHDYSFALPASTSSSGLLSDFELYTPASTQFADSPGSGGATSTALNFPSLDDTQNARQSTSPTSLLNASSRSNDALSRQRASNAHLSTLSRTSTTGSFGSSDFAFDAQLNTFDAALQITTTATTSPDSFSPSPNIPPRQPPPPPSQQTTALFSASDMHPSTEMYMLRRRIPKALHSIVDRNNQATGDAVADASLPSGGPLVWGVNRNANIAGEAAGHAGHATQETSARDVNRNAALQTIPQPSSDSSIPSTQPDANNARNHAASQSEATSKSINRSAQLASYQGSASLDIAASSLHGMDQAAGNATDKTTSHGLQSSAASRSSRDSLLAGSQRKENVHSASRKRSGMTSLQAASTPQSALLTVGRPEFTSSLTLSGERQQLGANTRKPADAAIAQSLSNGRNPARQEPAASRPRVAASNAAVRTNQFGSLSASQSAINGRSSAVDVASRSVMLQARPAVDATASAVTRPMASIRVAAALAATADSGPSINTDHRHKYRLASRGRTTLSPTQKLAVLGARQEEATATILPSSLQELCSLAAVVLLGVALFACLPRALLSAASWTHATGLLDGSDCPTFSSSSMLLLALLAPSTSSLRAHGKDDKTSLRREGAMTAMRSAVMV